MEATKTSSAVETESQGCTGVAEPQKEHQWLQQMVGEWDCQGEAIMVPDQPAVTWKGTETVRSIGGLWVVGEGVGEMPGGGESRNIMTIGFDPRKGRFTGTFIASMGTHLWIYDGELDASGKVLTLSAEGPSMNPEEKSYKSYRDVVEVVSPSQRTLTSFMQTPEGRWMQIMKATYRRK
jgi:hypothetical protein